MNSVCCITATLAPSAKPRQGQGDVVPVCSHLTWKAGRSLLRAQPLSGTLAKYHNLKALRLYLPTTLRRKRNLKATKRNGKHKGPGRLLTLKTAYQQHKDSNLIPTAHIESQEW